MTAVILIGCATAPESVTEEPLLVEVVEEPIHPDSPEGFKIERPWLLPDISVIDNPDYNAEDVFSSKYLLHDVTDIEISLNPEYIGEWLVYGKVKKVAFPSNELDGQLLYDYLIQNGDINSDCEEEFMNWRGVRFLDTGIVETNYGNQVLHYTQSELWGSIWTDGWIISETEQTRAHGII